MQRPDPSTVPDYIADHVARQKAIFDAQPDAPRWPDKPMERAMAMEQAGYSLEEIRKSCGRAPNLNFPILPE